MLITINELENELIDFQPYVDWYTHNYKNSLGEFSESRLYEYYIDLNARDEFDRAIISISEEVKKWLHQKTNNLLFILAEYGSGKTSFVRQFVYTLLDEKYNLKLEQKYIPILFNLKELRDSFNIQQLITDTLLNTYGVQISSFKAFEKICDSGKILLILDGFDEMADRSDKNTILNCFKQLYILATLNAKIILTCRSNFFQSHTDLINLLKNFSISVPISEKDHTENFQISFNKHGRIITLEKLNLEQRKEFIKRRFPDRYKKIIETMDKIHDLNDLSSRPVLLDMILNTWTQLSQSKKQHNSVSLYEFYTDQWAIRDSWRVKMSLELRKQFCESLAWMMYNYKTETINNNVLEKLILESFTYLGDNEDQIENFKNDIQTCSFLIRRGNEGNFAFAHKSFLEFFVAKKIIGELCQKIPIKPVEAIKYSTKKESEVKDVIPSLKNYSKVINFNIKDIYNFNNANFLNSGIIWTKKDSTKPNSNGLIKEFLGEKIKKIFNIQTANNFADIVSVTEEIATFAIEYLQNLNPKFKDFVLNLEDKNIHIFCDILRFNKSNSFIKENYKIISELLNLDISESIRASLIVALINAQYPISFDFIQKIKNTFTPYGWNYVIFELMSSQDHEEILYQLYMKQYYSAENISKIDTLICLQGIRNKFSESEYKSANFELIKSLLISELPDEKDLAIILCGSSLISNFSLLELLFYLVQNSSDFELKKKIISIIKSEGFLFSIDKNIFNKFLLMSKVEKNPYVKRFLKNAKTKYLDERNNLKIKSTHKYSNQSVIRDKMWKSIR